MYIIYKHNNDLWLSDNLYCTILENSAWRKILIFVNADTSINTVRGGCWKEKKKGDTERGNKHIYRIRVNGVRERGKWEKESGEH